VSDPFRHEQKTVAGQWAAHGTHFLTASYDHTAKLWPVWLVPNGPAPPWLADLAEISGGLSRDGDETYRLIGVREIATTHTQLKSLHQSDRWGNWLETFYAERPDR
jgi:hypothetical protein